MYGQVWRSQFKSEEFLTFAKGEWQKGLADFNDSILDRALEVCRQKHEMPPTLPKFFDVCRVFYKHQPITRPMKMEIVENRNLEVALENLKQIKTFLNIKTN